MQTYANHQNCLRGAFPKGSSGMLSFSISHKGLQKKTKNKHNINTKKNTHTYKKKHKQINGSTTQQKAKPASLCPRVRQKWSNDQGNQADLFDAEARES